MHRLTFLTMGDYINVIKGIRLPNKGKAAYILQNISGAIAIAPPTEWGEDLVCVVSNGAFDAAAYAYDQIELDRFNRIHDGRQKVWLRVPDAKKYVSK